MTKKKRRLRENKYLMSNAQDARLTKELFRKGYYERMLNSKNRDLRIKLAKRLKRYPYIDEWG